MFSLTYIRVRARHSDENLSQEHHKLVDDSGQQVKFRDQTEAPEKREDVVLRLWRQLPTEYPFLNMYTIGGVLTLFWGYRMSRTFNKLMDVRFADINYQLRRPDVIANKVIALKFLALPLTVIPVCAALTYWLSTVGSSGP